MEQTPKPAARPHKSNDVYLIGAVLAMWPLTFVLFWPATVIAGGHPRAGIFDYPGQAMESLMRDGGVYPWRWFGTSVHSARGFWTAAVVILAAAIVIPGGLWIFRNGIPVIRIPILDGPKAQDRYTGWATRKDLRKLLSKHLKPNRVVLGLYAYMLVLAEASVNVLLWGASRSGKTSGLVIPTILEASGAVLTTGIRGEILEKTIAYRSKKGDVMVYDPFNVTGRHNTNWKPQGGVRSLDDTMKRADALGQGLAATAKDSDTQGAAYFHGGATKLVAALLYIAAMGDYSVVEIREWINTSGGETQQRQVAVVPGQRVGKPDVTDAVQRAIERLRREGLGSGDDVKKAEEIYNSVSNSYISEKSAFFGHAMQIFGVFMEDSVARSAASHDLDIDRLILRGGTLYLIAPSEDQHRVACLFTAITDSVIRRGMALGASHPLNPMLTVVLEEAANVAPIRDLDKYASTCLGNGIKLVTIFQDMSQMISLYGESKTRSIVNNHQALGVLPGLKDDRTMSFLSAISGKERVSDESHGPGGKSVTERDRDVWRADGWRLVPDGRIRWIYKNYPLIELDQRRYYEDVELTAKSEMEYLGFMHEPDPVALAAIPASPTPTARRLRRYSARPSRD